MAKYFSTLITIVIMQMISLPVYAGKCTGSSNCRACSSCSSCKHCARKGGTCGVCSDDSSSGSTEASNFLGKAIAIGAGAVGVAYFAGKKNKTN